MVARTRLNLIRTLRVIFKNVQWCWSSRRHVVSCEKKLRQVFTFDTESFFFPDSKGFLTRFWSVRLHKLWTAHTSVYSGVNAIKYSISAPRGNHFEFIIEWGLCVWERERERERWAQTTRMEYVKVDTRRVYSCFFFTSGTQELYVRTIKYGEIRIAHSYVSKACCLLDTSLVSGNKIM